MKASRVKAIGVVLPASSEEVKRRSKALEEMSFEYGSELVSEGYGHISVNLIVFNEFRFLSAK